MPSIVWFLAILGTLLPAQAYRAPARGLPSVPSVQVTWTPERPVQGHLFTLVVMSDASDSVMAVEGDAAGEVLHFQATRGGRFEALAAIPVDAVDSLVVSLRVQKAGGVSEALTPAIPVAPGSYRHERLTVAPRMGSPLSPEDQARLARDQAKARQVSRDAHATPRMWEGAAVLPRQDRVTSEFGNGRVFNGQVSSRHLGLDLDGEPGDTVVAPAPGVVALVDEFLLAGNIVYLNHGGGLISGYFHLSDQLVAAGDTVQPGTPIGLVGATGRVTGPHLHWVVRYGTVSVDPRSMPGLAAAPPGGR